MCDTCGCGQPDNVVTIRKAGQAREEHPAHHGHSHHHSRGHHLHDGRTVAVEEDILSRNRALAEHNRQFFEKQKILALNLVSSPGSGKTTLLEQTIARMKDDLSFAVIEGDQQSMQDANRIEKTGVPVVQVNTGTACHLDAAMIGRAIEQLSLKNGSALMIENVGNLICPALFDLGEAFKVVIISVTEGDDKPLKYPTMFDVAHICVINKIDLLPYVEFDMSRCKRYALQVNHHLEFFDLSAKTGTGLEEWNNWIRRETEVVFGTKVSGV